MNLFIGDKFLEPSTRRVVAAQFLFYFICAYQFEVFEQKVDKVKIDCVNPERTVKSRDSFHRWILLCVYNESNMKTVAPNEPRPRFWLRGKVHRRIVGHNRSDRIHMEFERRYFTVR